MNGHTLRTLACLSVLWLAACGGGKFSEDFSPELRKDCTETLNCNTANNTPGDQVQRCVTTAGDRLDNASVGVQQNFVDTVTRCTGNVQCGYVNCTMSDPTMGYAGAHQAQITYDCQQRAACRIANKQTTAATEVSDCVSQTSAILNGNAEMAIAFDAKYMRCSTFQGCSWNTCQ